jgi:cellulose synthase/poly-beta-1,6-N-acetylglucosamine synthase-like glycosyltransferase
MVGPIQVLTICLLATPLAIMGLYGLTLMLYYKRKNPRNNERAENGSQTSRPKVSVLVPTHNENRIISKKIDNLLSTCYPIERIEFVFIDDSDDSTPSIIQRYASRFSNIHLIHFDNRMGYSASMIAGCKSANGEILVFNDAGSFLEKSAIENLVRHFQDRQIGGVTGRGMLLNKNESVSRSEDLYLQLSDFMRTAETRMDSTFHFSGEACAVRKELVTDLDSVPATFDTAVALHVRRKGYKTIYDPQVRFYEYAPYTHSDRIKQKTIRATNLIKILLEFDDMAFRRKHGRFGCFILPMNLAMLTIVPVVILLSLVSLAVLTFFDPVFALTIWGLLALVFLLSMIFGKKIAVTFLEFEYSLLKAFWRVLFTNKSYDKIETIASTRR